MARVTLALVDAGIAPPSIAPPLVAKAAQYPS
jgi:hypothetical protein